MRQLVIKARTDNAALCELWDKVNRYAYKVAAKYRTLADIDDLKQEAFLAYTAAVQNYNPDGEFLPYMGKVVERQIKRYITKNNTGAFIPEYKRTQSAKLKKYKADFYKAHGRAPSKKEAAAAFGITTKEIDDLDAVDLLISSRSIYTPIEEELTLGDTIADPRQDIEDATRAEDRDKMAQDLNTALDEIEGGDILRLMYFEELSGRKAAARANTTPGKARRLMNRAAAELRKRKRIEAYYNSYLKTDFYHGSGLTRFLITQESSVEHIVFERLRA